MHFYFIHCFCFCESSFTFLLIENTSRSHHSDPSAKNDTGQNSTFLQCLRLVLRVQILLYCCPYLFQALPGFLEQRKVGYVVACPPSSGTVTLNATTQHLTLAPGIDTTCHLCKTLQSLSASMASNPVPPLPKCRLNPFLPSGYSCLTSGLCLHFSGGG